MSRPIVERVLAAGVVVAVAGVGASGCVEPGPEGTAGVRGIAVFQAPTDLAWSERLVVGSVFDVTAVAREKKNVLGEATTVESSDGDVVTISDVTVKDGEARFRVNIAAPGEVDLVVADDGAEVDHIRLQAARAATTTLVDAALVGATEEVEPSLPERFAVLADEGTRVLVAATDVCGGALLDLNASQILVDAPTGIDPATLATVFTDGAASFVIQPAAVGAFRLQLQSPALDPLGWDVDVVRRADIDEVAAVPASADVGTGSVTLWGRAFVDDVEVVGVDFSWTPSERVTLSTTTGPATTATISFPAQEEPADDRPATVTTEIAGEEGDVDLLTLTDTDLVVARDAPPERDSDAADDEEEGDGSWSCGGGEACDPLAALLPCAPLVGPRRRRRRAQ